MSESYKITSLSKWKYYYKILLTTFVLHTFGGIVFIYFNEIKNINLGITVLFWILLSWFVFFALPVFLLYFNHKKHSKHVVLKQKDGFFTFSDFEESINFNIKEIEKIELYLTPPAYDKRIDILYFGKYHYTSIYLINGKALNISCLVFDKTVKIFPKELINKKKKNFPFIKG